MADYSENVSAQLESDCQIERLADFKGAKLYEASSKFGGGWERYGILRGTVRVGMITRSDPNRRRDMRGWGVMTRLDPEYGHCTLNILIHENFVLQPIQKDPLRLTFKAPSRVFSNSGRVNTYSLVMASHQDAADLRYCLLTLQLAAREAMAGRPILVPRDSREAHFSSAFGREDADRRLILSQLNQLAMANGPFMSSVSHEWTWSPFASLFGPPEHLETARNQELVPAAEHDLGQIPEDEAVDESSILIGSLDTVGGVQEAQGSIEDDGSDEDSLGSNSDFPFSQVPFSQDISVAFPWM